MKRNLFVCMAAMGIAGGLALSARAEDPYIESDGTQAVVLDYFVNPKTKIVADFAFQAPLTRQWRLFGVEGSSAVFACLYISNGDVYSWSWRNSSGNYSWTYVPVTTDRRTITLDGPNKKIQVAKDGNVETNLTMAAVTATATHPLGLFCDVADASGTVVANKCKAKVYSFKIYEDDELVMDLEPWQGTDGSYALKDVVGGKVYLPMTGNPLAGGGDIVHTSDAYTWTGAESSAWNATANWQVDGSAALRPPQTGDDVAIAAGSTVDIGDIVGTASTLALAGNGTVALTGTQPRNLAALLTVASGTTLSLAADTTLRVPAATYGGAPVADGRYAAGDLPWLVGSGTLIVGNPGARVEDGTLILDVSQGQTLAYYTQLASPITKIVKLGAGTAIVSNDNNSAWVGTVDIKEGILEAQSGVTGTATIPVFGRNAANTITVFKGAQLLARIRSGNSQTDQRFQNSLVIAGDGPDGYGAVRLVRTGGSTHLDRLFTNVTLSDDASVFGSHRLGFSSGTVNLNGHTLTHRPIATGSSEFMMYNATMKNGHLHAKNGSSMVAQGTVKYQGSADDTLTFDSGTYFSMWNVTFSQFDWTTILKGGSWLRAASGGTSSTANRILGPVVLDGGTVIVTNYSPATVAALNLNGPVSGTGKMFQNGIMNTYLRNTANTWKGGLEVKCGTVWAQETGSLPPVGPLRASGSGAINFVAKNWDLATLHNTLTNWDGSGAVNVYTAAGENFTDGVDFEHATFYRHGGPGTLMFTAGTTPDGATKLINGEGEMVVAGNKTRRLTQLNVQGGTMTLENAGYIWCGTWDVANNAHKANSTWTVGGTNTNAPAKMVVKSGTVIDTFVPGAASSSSISVEDSGTKGAILEVHDGAAITNKLNVGFNSGKMGAVYQYGGNMRVISYGSNDGFSGRYANSYGYVDLMGGTLAMRSWWRFGGHPTSVGMLRISGGTFTADSSLCVSFGGWGELYMTGGVFRSGGAIHIGELHWGDKTAGNYDTRRGLVTLGGSGSPSMTIAGWLDVCERTNQFVGVVNMNAGVLATPTFAKSDYEVNNRDNDTAKAYVNFGGGAWKAYDSSSAIFSSGLRKVDRVTVFPGGATLDINGKSSSNGAVPFEKPFGKGVASIAWPSGTSTNGYLGAPEVYITGGGGTGAVAHCTFDARTGTIGEIVVASPGWGYTGAPTATIKSADRKTTIACAVTMTDGEEQPGGGLTLTNSSATAGTFTLSSANSYTGATVVAGGTLKLGAADAIPSANEVRLAGGTFDAASYDVSYARVGGYGTLKGNVTVTDKLVFDAAQSPLAGLTVNGTFNVANGVTVEIANTNLLARGTTYTLATFPTPLASVPASNLEKPWCVFLTNGGKTLKMHYQAATMFLVR